MNDTSHPAGHVLQAFHDGELEPSVAADVGAHCELCEVCRAELAELEQTGQWLAGAQTPELPRSVWHRVGPGRAQESRFRPSYALAACAAGVVIGFLVGPVQFRAEDSGTEVAWSPSVTVWDGGTSSSLLDVYQSGSE